VNVMRDAGLVVPATRSEATPPPTPAAHDGTKLRLASWIAICPRAWDGGVAEWPARPRTVPSSRVSRIVFTSFIFHYRFLFALYVVRVTKGKVIKHLFWTDRNRERSVYREKRSGET
jgi:hypothetical protein